MARDNKKRKERLKKRDRLLIAEYDRLRAFKNDKGIQKYGYAYILSEVAEKFTLAELTVERIINNRAIYEPGE